jgi:UrcA family protein
MIKPITAAFAASLFVASPTFAQDLDAQTQIVKTSDINLASADGRIELKQRIKSAARRVCNDGPIVGVKAASLEAQCVRKTIEDTRPKVAALLAASGIQVAMTDQKPNQ